MKRIDDLLRQNQMWAESQRSNDPEYFARLAKEQKPRFLWIGCSDSRVPANEITGTHSGDMFVHRNIANLVVHTDINLLSVMQYAIEVLRVEHIIVCGHYGCGGVNAALENTSFGLLDSWLRNIKDVYLLHRNEIDALPTAEERSARLVELNVRNQVARLAGSPLVQKAWDNQQNLALHGWVYGLTDGRLKPLYTMTSSDAAQDSNLRPKEAPPSEFPAPIRSKAC